jgi:hypothetical protein
MLLIVHSENYYESISKPFLFEITSPSRANEVRTIELSLGVPASPRFIDDCDFDKLEADV